MANNIIVIDFFGLPGCGKSVISHELARLFESGGININEVSYNMDHRNHPFMRLLKKTCSTLLYALFHPILFIDLIKVIGCNRSPMNLISQIRNLCYKLFLLHDSKSVFVFDEGFVQSSISITLGTDKSCSAIFKTILNYIPKGTVYIVVHLKTTIQTSMENMALRKTKDSRVEKMNNINIQKLYMESFEEMTKELSSIANISINVDKTETPTNIAKHIVEKINTYYKIV